MNNKKLLKESADYIYFSRPLLFITFIIFASVIVVFAMTFDSYIQASLIVLLSEFILLSPAYIYCIYKIIRIRRKSQDYIFQKTLFDNPHTGFNNRLYFTLKIKNKDNEEMQVDTKCIFACNIFANPNFEDYNNKMVLIGYNEKTEEVVTIKPVN